MCVNRHADKIALCATYIAVFILMVMLHGEALGIRMANVSSNHSSYEERLFDTSQVHEINIIMEEWEDFLASCEDEAYAPCSVVIDGERLNNVGIRAKGNTSLANVRMMGSQRYSLKLEFDHYQTGKTYYGLDKLCLNNLIQDNTYMKDYLTFRMMSAFRVPAPLCSYVQIEVNGKPWGLFLAIEGVEKSFLQRNYGHATGSLYKPDAMGFGRGPGGEPPPGIENDGFPPPPPDMGNGGFPPPLPDMGMGNGGFPPLPPDMGNGEFPPSPPGTGSKDVMLQYIDDEPGSYANIFSSAKTHCTRGDQIRLIRSLKKLGESLTNLEGNRIDDALRFEDVLRYFIVHNYVVNGDSYTGGMIHNYYLYEDVGKLSMIPWDYNLAFGGFQGRNASEAVNDPVDTPLSVSGDGSRPMVDWILQEPYLKLYHGYFKTFLRDIKPEIIIDSTYKLISSYVASNELDPTHFCSRSEFELGVETLRKFCELRTESLKGQLAGEIPSTNTGQQESGSKLIDASSLNLSAMGTMGGPGAAPPPRN